MPKKPRTRKTEEERRVQIIDAARTLFKIKGFEGVSTKEIAEEEGLSRALVYRYDASKTEILEDIFRDMVREEARLLQEMRRPQGTATERVVAYLAKLFEYDFAEFELRRLVVQHSWTWSREREIEFFDLVGSIMDPISDCLREIGIDQTIPDRIAIWAIYTEGLRQTMNRFASEQSMDVPAFGQESLSEFVDLVLPQIDRLMS